jgi:hypothetical protein
VDLLKNSQVKMNIPVTQVRFSQEGIELFLDGDASCLLLPNFLAANNLSGFEVADRIMKTNDLKIECSTDMTDGHLANRLKILGLSEAVTIRFQ